MAHVSEIRIFAATISATPLDEAYQGGTYFFVPMSTYTKQPLRVDEQIEMLKRRGLHFDDESAAIEKLKVISYFRLANYWKPMESDKQRHVFKADSKFADVVALYDFDKELRSLIFSAVQSIEIALRTKVVQIVSSEHGPFWFAEEALFSHSSIFSLCLARIKSELERSKEDFLLEHFVRYDEPPYPPAWKTLEVTSLGTLSKLYCNLSDNHLKKRIAKELGLPQHLYLESWIKSLSVLRNCVAHHARIWNRKYPWKPQLPRKLPHSWIEGKGVLQEKLYAQLCCIAYLMDAIQPDNTFKLRLKELLADHPIVDVAAMGFTKGWHDEALWA